MCRVGRPCRTSRKTQNTKETEKKMNDGNMINAIDGLMRAVASAGGRAGESAYPEKAKTETPPCGRRAALAKDVRR